MHARAHARTHARTHATDTHAQTRTLCRRNRLRVPLCRVQRRTSFSIGSRTTTPTRKSSSKCPYSPALFAKALLSDCTRITTPHAQAQTAARKRTSARTYARACASVHPDTRTHSWVIRCSTGHAGSGSAAAVMRVRETRRWLGLEHVVYCTGSRGGERQAHQKDERRQAQ